ncbi:MAG TPA: GAP family protein [Mycobacterium sp.]|uniref:GAP family protein n=1 Tax=Mycobacterium sp. TaxID=1785 RepID=UPI002B71456B|nr:GAP family protein [Mycobacterium sp.]HME76012.1 GAP family protein [Mycobacterium sp.]
MWFTVILMAIVAAVDPMRVATIVVILARRRPVRHLVAYLIGGFGVSLIVGAVILFALEGVGVGSRSGIPAEIEIAVGVLALLAAALVGSGIADKVRSRRQARRITAGGEDADTTTTTATTSAVPQGIEQLAAFQKLPGPIQKVLRSESAWVGWIAGVAIGMPSAYYLAAIAAILGAGAGVTSSVAALIVFNVIAFMLSEVFLVSFLSAPEATRERVHQLYVWTQDHHRLVVTVLAAIVGVYLLIVGIGKL